ncbi:MAG: HAD-IA family hydrolase [Ruminococcus sp.]
MKSYKYLLFDLDGTLTDSEEGILNCVRYGLESCGFPVPEYEVLRAFIGPPLMYSCTHFCGLSRADAERAILKYRERYSEKGIFENRLYEGIKELLSDLKNAGYKIALATSKPEVFALRILEHFGIAEYFDAAAGSTIGREDETKADMIRLAMKRLGLNETDKPHVLMIGDRKHDIIGAHECGVDAAGVCYGFAPEGELREYGADYILDDVDSLGKMLI